MPRSCSHVAHNASLLTDAVHCHVGSQTGLVVCFCNDRYLEAMAPQSSLSGGADEHYKVLEITSLKHVLRKSYSTEFQEENLKKCTYSFPS